MNKDHKLMSVMIPVIFILSIGFYGIPGALGSDTNPLITEVDYNGNTHDLNIGSNVTNTQETDNENLDQQDNTVQSTDNVGSDTGTNTRPNPQPNPAPGPGPSPEPEPEPEPNPPEEPVNPPGPEI